MISAPWAPGFLFLAILPTTISTAIVYTSVSGGDSVAATFNATLSNLLGIIAVPLWCAFFVFPIEVVIVWSGVYVLTNLKPPNPLTTFMNSECHTSYIHEP